MPGNIMSSILRGNKTFDDATRKVNVCIEKYTSSVVDLGVSLNMQLITYARGIQASVDELSDRFGTFFSTFETHVRIVEAGIQDKEMAPDLVCRTSFLVPFERNPMFQGRDAVIESIHHNLLQTSSRRYNHRLAIHGLGGIGKTQIAVEYAYRHRAEYDYCFWLHAAERTSLISDLATIARETACVPVKDESQLEVIALQVLKWLNRQNKSLVILDNLDDVTVAKGLIPTSEYGGHVLITTRNHDVKKIPAQGLEITELPESDAVELLIQVSEYQYAEILAEAKRVVWELGMLRSQSIKRRRLSKFADSIRF